jgi:ornithine--oxo-acid transaminase
MMSSKELIDLADRFGAPNYKPLPVVVAEGQGSWVTDPEGKRYLDCLSSYSALNFGHCHPEILEVFLAQAQRCTLTSRAFHNDQLGPFLKKLTSVCEMEMALPMNTGAEAVETALKAARKWGYQVKGVEKDQAEILVCENNFHGRTITVVSFSTEAAYRNGFGPFTPGFRSIPYGDLEAFKTALTPNTVAFLVEPIQGEAGVVVPSHEFMVETSRICKEQQVLFVADEIQTGLGRTGKMFCCEHYGIRPDAYILGKALGAGVYPVSAVVSSREILSVFNPGEHGSTFGGNPLGAAVATEALRILIDQRLAERSLQLGEALMLRLKTLSSPMITEVRGKGLMIGIVLKPEAGGARRYCEALKERGVLCKETHEHVIRIAPPLTVTQQELDFAWEALVQVFSESFE